MSIDPKIQAWIDAEMDVEEATERANRLFREAEESAVPPEFFRPAVEGDIRPGAIIWYRLDEGKERWYWSRVERVLSAGGKFKAYYAFSAWHGRRCGLAHAFVEKEGPDA